MNDLATETGGNEGQGSAPIEASEAGNAPWYGKIDEELGGYIDNKGWKSAKDAALGYRNLEKLFGADRAGNTVMIPKEGDEQAWDAFYGRLGRPGEASMYELGQTEDSEDLSWFKEIAFKNGLSQNQAAAIYEGYQEILNQYEAEQAEQFDLKAQQDLTELKRTWGRAYEANIQAGRSAANRFGFTHDELSAMESAVGTKALLEKFANIGRAFGEDKFESGDRQESGFAMTPGQAKAKIGELKGDRDFYEAYLNSSKPGHRDAVEKMQRLMSAAYPEG